MPVHRRVVDPSANRPSGAQTDRPKSVAPQQSAPRPLTRRPSVTPTDLGPTDLGPLQLLQPDDQQQPDEQPQHGLMPRVEPSHLQHNRVYDHSAAEEGFGHKLGGARGVRHIQVTPREHEDGSLPRLIGQGSPEESHMPSIQAETQMQLDKLAHHMKNIKQTRDAAADESAEADKPTPAPMPSLNRQIKLARLMLDVDGPPHAPVPTFGVNENGPLVA